MAVLRTVLTIILILVSIVFTAIVLMQEGKSAGLGAISGAAETYWGKNKGRSMEGTLVKLTKVLGVVFILPVFFGINGIWLSVATAELLTLFVTITFLIRKRQEYHYV